MNAVSLGNSFPNMTGSSPQIRMGGSAASKPSLLKEVASRIIPPKKLPPPRRSSPPSRARRSEGFEDSPDFWQIVVGFFFLVLVIFALSPGVLLTLPPGRGKIWMSGTTSTAAAFVHAILIVVILSLL